jgi:hypothetical protein
MNSECKYLVPSKSATKKSWITFNTHNNKHSLRNNADGYGSKTHYTDSEDSNNMAPSGRKLYYLK